PGDGRQLGPGLVGPPPVLGVAAAFGLHLQDPGVQFLEPGVHRAELLLVQPREVLHLDAEGLHGDLELDQRLFGGPYGLFQALLGPRRTRTGRLPPRVGAAATLLTLRGRHPDSLGHLPDPVRPSRGVSGPDTVPDLVPGTGPRTGPSTGARHRHRFRTQTPSSAAMRPDRTAVTRSAWSASVRSA